MHDGVKHCRLILMGQIMPKTKLPDEVLEYFRKQGAKGGKVGGKKAAKNMTAEQRRKRAQNAAQKRWEAKRLEMKNG